MAWKNLSQTSLADSLVAHHRALEELDDVHNLVDWSIINLAENAIRPFVVGRKNWLFSNSTNGAKASANLYSLIETAKAHQVEPYHYLRWVLDKLSEVQTIEQVDALMPDQFKLEKGAVY